jgi:hypothetical protein
MMHILTQYLIGNRSVVHVRYCYRLHILQNDVMYLLLRLDHKRRLYTGNIDKTGKISIFMETRAI